MNFPILKGLNIHCLLVFNFSHDVNINTNTSKFRYLI